MKSRYAVMGNPVDHSLSPIIHQLFAQQTGRELIYEKIKIDLPFFEQQVAQFFDKGGLGLNITLPCKQTAFALADKVTARCLQARAANTLWRNVSGLQADNTDGIGLMRDLSRYLDVAGKRVLLMGAGGAARGILAPLLAANPAQLLIANRTQEKARALSVEFVPAIYCDLAELSEPFDLIINATAASLENQHVERLSAMINSNTICYDLAYRYKDKTFTPFVAWANSQGCVGMDGRGMLVEQAAEAFFIWHGVKPDVLPVLKYLHALS